MAAANPALFAGKGAVGSVPLAAGTVLNVPPNLPRPVTAATPTPAVTKGEAVAAPKKKAPAAPEAMAAASGKTPDRLVIGGNAAGIKPLSPRELAAAVDRLERMVEDQGRIHLGMSESIKTVEIAFGDLRTNLLAIEARMKALEIERIKAETERARAMAALAEERARFGFLEMLALVLASGAIGAGLIHFYHRLQGRRPGFEAHAGMALPPAAEARSTSGIETLVTAPPEPPAAPAAPAAPPSRPAPKPVVTPVVTSVATSVQALAAAPMPAAAATPPPPSAAKPADVTPAPVPSAAPELAVPVTPAAETTAQLIDTVSPGNPPPSPQAEAVPLPSMIEFTLEELPPHAVSPEPTFTPPQVKPRPPAMAEPEVPGAGYRDPAIELAEVMESMGLAHGAAHTLVEHVRGNPAESVQHWLKLLDLRQRAGLQEQLADSVQELKVMFNVAIDDDGAQSASASLADYHHLSKELIAVWGKPECRDFLLNLIADTREGTRAGFPRAVVEEILLLRAMLDNG